jgi:hypothetical protein
MKLLKIRWLFLIIVTAAGFAGVVSSNVGCGDSGGSAGSGGGGPGGTSSGGGTGGGTGGAVTPRVVYVFDTATSADSMAWKLNDYVDATPAKNLGSYMIADAGLTLAEPPTMEWANEDSEASTSSGSMKVSVTFTDFGQYVDPVINLPAVVDLSNRTVTMKIRLVSGTFSVGGVQPHVSTGAGYVYLAGTWMNGPELAGGAWKTLQVVTTGAPTTNDTTMVIQLGIQITAGAATAGATPPTGRLVFEIDTIKG